jgi:hypothetical protein
MPTTITGTIKNLDTTTPGTSSFVRFWLRALRGNPPRITGTGAIVPQSAGNSFYVDVPANSSGVVAGTIYSTRDSTGVLGGDIEAGGSLTAVYYGMVIYNAGIPGPEIPVHAKNGASLDISNVTPTSTQPIIVAPTGDTTYARLDGGNTPFTGIVQFLQGILLALGKSVAWSTDLFLGRGAAGKLTIGTTAGATDGTVSAALYQVGGVSQSGTGPLAGTVSPAFTTPSLGVATATSVATGQIIQPAATALTIKDNTGGTRFSIPSGGVAQSTLNNTSLVGAGASNSVELLNGQGPISALVGNAADQTLYTFTVPANTVGAGKGLRVKVAYIKNVGVVSTTFKVIIGAITIESFAYVCAGANTQFEMWELDIINNAGVQNAQFWLAQETIFDTGTADRIRPNVGTSAVDFTATQAVKFTFNVAATDQVTPKFWSLELIQ